MLAFAKIHDGHVSNRGLKEEKAMSEATEKLKILEETIADDLPRFEASRRRDKRKSFYLSVGAIVLSALATALLGLRLTSPRVRDLFANLALVIGVVVTALNAYDAHFNHRALSVEQTVLVNRLTDLQRRVSFYKGGIAADNLT